MVSYTLKGWRSEKYVQQYGCWSGDAGWYYFFVVVVM